MTDPSAIKACTMTLYPSKDSLVEAVQFIESQAPLNQEDIFHMLMIYHNTLIKEIASQRPHNVVSITAAKQP